MFDTTYIEQILGRELTSQEKKDTLKLTEEYHYYSDNSLKQELKCIFEGLDLSDLNGVYKIILAQLEEK